MIKIPEFKGRFITVGNSKAILVPAKMREDYGVEDDVEYWVEIKLRRTIEAAR